MEKMREYKTYLCFTCRNVDDAPGLHCSCGGFKFWTGKTIMMPVEKKISKAQKTLSIILAN